MFRVRDLNEFAKRLLLLQNREVHLFSGVGSLKKVGEERGVKCLSYIFYDS